MVAIIPYSHYYWMVGPPNIYFHEATRPDIHVVVAIAVLALLGVFRAPGPSRKSHCSSATSCNVFLRSSDKLNLPPSVPFRPNGLEPQVNS